MKSGDFLPLASAALHILLALAGQELHGYGIMKEISRQTDGRYKLGPGTLYDNLHRLLAQQLVQPATRRGEDRAGDDPRRRYYRLTATGRKVLAAELDRLETLIRSARPQLKLGPQVKPGRA
jgi:DNA-binding PadR family transcriptional regulator